MARNTICVEDIVCTLLKNRGEVILGYTNQKRMLKLLVTYREFIQQIIEERGRFGCGDEYHERHHIVPLCMGGKTVENNLIDLLAKEHFIAHKLLAFENPDNLGLVRAYCVMAFTKNKDQKRIELTPEEYEEVRKLVSEKTKEFYADKTNHPNYGKHLSEETRRKIGLANKGTKSSVGRPCSEETRKKIGDANRNPSEETRKRMSESQKRRNLNGGNNPRAKKVIRVSDNYQYACIGDAARDNSISPEVLKKQAKKGLYIIAD